MGGRTAVHLLDEPGVVSLVALAPWLPDEPTGDVAGTDVLVAHGTRDGRTSPRQARSWVERARQQGAAATYVDVVGSGHALLRRRRVWTQLTVGFALATLGVQVRVDDDVRRVITTPGEHRL